MKRLILCAALALPVASCSLTGQMTPEEQAKVEQLRADDTPESNAEADALERSAAERAVGGIVGFVDPFIPAPLQPFVPLLATLFFKRVRRTTVKSLKNVGEVAKNTITGDFTKAGQAIGDAVDSTLSIVGLKDSRNDTADDMQAWADSVRETDPTLATALDAKVAELRSA